MARWAGTLLLTAAPVSMPLSATATSEQTAALTVVQADLVARANRLGATDIRTQPAPQGGFILGGKLDGDQFAVAFPANWNGNALLFAHGYSTPGSPIAASSGTCEVAMQKPDELALLRAEENSGMPEPPP